MDFLMKKNSSKYLNIADTGRYSEISKKYNQVFDGIKYYIKTINNNDSKYDKDYMEIKFNTDDHILLNKQLIFLTITVSSTKMIQFERIDISEGIDFNKTSKSLECIICHYWNFKDVGFK